MALIKTSNFQGRLKIRGGEKGGQIVIQSPCLGMNYYVNFWGGIKWQWISHKMNIRHPGQLKKSKSWELFWSYQPNSTANLAHLPSNLAKWDELAVLFCWYVAPKQPSGFWLPWVPNLHFIWNSLLTKPPKSWPNNSFLGKVQGLW